MPSPTTVMKLLLPVAALAGCAGADGAMDLPPAAGAEYVAMGSSFAAGAGIGPRKPGSPERCNRTVNNYASLLAQELGLSLVDQGCGGATTAHLVAPWNELSAQVDAINESTRLVTVTVGGNDLNLMGVLFMASCTPGETVGSGAYQTICTPPVAPPEEAYDAMAQGLTAIARAVGQRAPHARLVFVQYVSLVPDEPCERADLSPENAAMARTIARRLAATTAEVARENGALLLEADRISREHTPCDTVPWANGMPGSADSAAGAAWHPNAAGHAAIAEALVGLLRTP